jgi:cell division protein FtsW (lipid II flippase)
MALSLPVVFGLTNLTCYYYSMFILGAVLIRARPTIGPAFLAVSGASQVVLHYYYWVDDKYVAMSWLYLLLCVMLLYVYSRPFSFARLKAWWDRKREPKSAFQLNRKHSTAVWLGP